MVLGETAPPPVEEFVQQTSPDLDLLLKKLRKKRVLERAKTIKFQSRVFTVPKKDSPEGRWVMDLSILNSFIKCPKFKMLTMREVKILLPRGYWSVSLDFKDGYWHIAVCPRKRPFLGFIYRNQKWQFRAMPFGLNIAPRIFTKLVAHIVKVMAAEGIWCLPYLDDLLILAPTKELCLQHLGKAVEILKSFGWILNQEKSRQEPAQIFEWLGVNFDLISHSANSTQDHMEGLQQQLISMIKSKYCSRRKIMKLQGLANWIGQTNMIIRLLLARTKILLRVFKTSPQCPDSSHQGHEAQPDQMDQNTSDPTTIREPYTYRDNTNRCVIKRLGLPNQSESIRRKFRPVNEQLVNKLVGTAHNMVRLAHGYTEEPSYSSAMRQLHSGGGNQTRYHNSAPTINGDRADMEENYYDGMDPNGITYTRKVQHNRRSVEPKGSTINRMVLTRQRVQKYPKDKSRTASRLVRYTPKPQTGHLRIPVSRSESNSSGCNVNPLEPMETPVPLSPVIHDFEGFEQIVRDEIQERNTDNTRNALQAMVHGTETPADPIISNESSPTADCSGQDGESSQPDQTSRLAIIEAGYKKQYPELPPEAIKLMARPVRKVSMKEYQQKWKAFILFLRSKNMPFDKISVTNVIQFLCFLFYERNLSPGTVTHYRTALVVPLQIYFNIDLKIPAVTDILRAMCLQRPKTPSSAPAWSLNKVLEFLERLPTDLSMEMLLRKTAFLLLLATGWRISELQACVRDLEFCFFTRDSSLRIRPHPSFLAKNERSQERWEHKEIKVLILQDGSISKLCPVTSLKSYLKRTSKFRKGKLFLTPGNPQKIMSVYSLSKLICDVILMADPATKAKVHDVRKYASACSYASTMLTGELVQAMNWNSPVTFFKFYFCQTEPLNRPVSLPLQNRTEQ